MLQHIAAQPQPRAVIPDHSPLAGGLARRSLLIARYFLSNVANVATGSVTRRYILGRKNFEDVSSMTGTNGIRVNSGVYFNASGGIIAEIRQK